MNFGSIAFKSQASFSRESSLGIKSIPLEAIVVGQFFFNDFSVDFTETEHQIAAKQDGLALFEEQQTVPKMHFGWIIEASKAEAITR